MLLHSVNSFLLFYSDNVVDSFLLFYSDNVHNTMHPAPQTLTASIFTHSFSFTHPEGKQLERMQKPSVLEFDIGVAADFVPHAQQAPACHPHGWSRPFVILSRACCARQRRRSNVSCNDVPDSAAAVIFVFLTAAPRRCANTRQCCHGTTRWPATEECCRCCSAAVRLKRP